MKIFSAAQIKKWDQFTIQNEPVSSIDLMERASQKCVAWILNQPFADKTFKIFCGKGNNGGDGLAIARLLLSAGKKVSVYVVDIGQSSTEDFELNFDRLQRMSTNIHLISTTTGIPHTKNEEVVIDALFGSGLSRPLDGLNAEVVDHINQASVVISIDLPSGLYADKSSKENKVIKANYTLSFQTYKLAFLVAENASYLGDIFILDIDLSEQFQENEDADFLMTDSAFINKIYKPRNRFTHKGNFGHALLIAGSYGKIGAAVLAAKACIHSGAGLFTVYLPKCGYNIMQTSVPEAMVVTDVDDYFITDIPEVEKYNSIGVGPGIGVDEVVQTAIKKFITKINHPVVFDADALNCLSLNQHRLHQLPPYSILSPHPKEFDRLFGDQENDFERIKTAIKKAKELTVIIVLKGHHTLIALPDGKAYFNNTGNAGMAKGGSGDVLTGIITSLVAQGYEPADAATFGVYLNGLAGDLAAKDLSQEAMSATDLIEYLGKAFLQLHSEVPQL